MNNDYEGENFTHSYCYDIINQQEVSKKFNFDFSREDLISKDSTSKEKMNSKLIRTLSIGRKRNFKLTQEDITKNTIYDYLGSFPEGEIITKETLNNLTKKLADEIIEFWIANDLIK